MKENHFLIGTAGHVDHGKTRLIEALTGTNTDRLKEEKERGISIELGFAHMILPDGRKAGIVDVPGHEKFVRQMLAGAGGMDLVLFVIAADEGVMPQTREHLEILNLLKLEKGIIVLTKIDLVDQEWLELIEQDIREKLGESFLKDAPLCKISSVTGEGFPFLVETIMGELSNAENKRTDLPARMAIDRVFTIQGFGTVVTGTVKSGVFRVGQEVKVEPGGQSVRIRNIQVHGEQETQVFAGQRAAINVSTLAISDIIRGSSLVLPGYYNVGKIIDVELANLAGEKRNIKQRQRIHFHLGTAEITGRVHLLEQEELLPGETGFAQIILEEEVLASPGDRFVVRYFSPVITIGGGTVLGIASVKRKRFKENVINDLQLKARGGAKKLVLKELNFPCSLKEIVKATELGEADVIKALEESREEARVLIFTEDGKDLFWNLEAAENLGQRACLEAEAYQKQNPLRGGIGREELKRKIAADLALKRWQLVLEWTASKGFVRISGNLIEALPEVRLTGNIEKKIECLVKFWEKAGLNPPDIKEGVTACGIPSEQGTEYAGYLTLKGLWVKIDDFYFSYGHVKNAKETLRELLLVKGEITVSEAREHWQVSRKYAVPLLEYFDSINVTRREGNVRYLHEDKL